MRLNKYNLQKKIVLLISILFISKNTIASPSYDNGCPPLSIVKDAQFIRAVKIPDPKRHPLKPDFGSWELLTPIFNYNGLGYTWNILFDVLLPPNVSTSDQALQVGQKYYDEQLVLHPPLRVAGPSGVMCIYANDSFYFVIANSPPKI